MIFGLKRKRSDYPISIKIEGETLEVVGHTKLLGVILEQDLNWKKHTEYIAKKIAKSVGIISRARQILSPDVLKQLYFSFLYPYLIYCIEAWGLAPDITLYPIFKLQKRAIRLIGNIRRRDSTQTT